MRRALYELSAAVKKLVRKPVEIDAGMRAVIEVTENVFTPAHDEELKLVPGLTNPETPCLLIRDITQGANIMQFHLVDLLMNGDFHCVDYLCP